MARKVFTVDVDASPEEVTEAFKTLGEDTKAKAVYDHDYQRGVFDACRRCGDGPHGPEGTEVE